MIFNTIHKRLFASEMKMKYLFFLLAFFTIQKFALADVTLDPLPNNNEYTIKITKSVYEKDIGDLKNIIKKIKIDKLKLRMNAVQLDLDGGSPYAALALGRIIRSNKLNTFIAPNTDCVSACIFVAISGVHRMMYGNILLHRATIKTEDGLLNKSLKKTLLNLTQDSNKYITEMGSSVMLAEALRFTPNWGLRRLTSDEIKHWGIHGSEHLYEENLFTKGAIRAQVKKQDFTAAFVDYFEVCKREEYLFRQFIVDCTVDKILNNKKHQT